MTFQRSALLMKVFRMTQNKTVCSEAPQQRPVRGHLALLELIASAALKLLRSHVDRAGGQQLDLQSHSFST